MNKRLVFPLAVTVLFLALVAPASAAFNLVDTTASFSEEDGTPLRQAGAHPFAFTTSVGVSTTVNDKGKEVPDGEVEDLDVSQIAGLTGQPGATPLCTSAAFIERANGKPNCPNSSAVGITKVHASFEPLPAGIDEAYFVPVFNLVPPPGVVAKLGFVILNEPITVEVTVKQTPPFNLQAHLDRIPQILLLYSSDFTIWGVPADPAHDAVRGSCLSGGLSLEPVSEGLCPVDVSERPFLAMPRSCRGDLSTTISATAWNNGGSASAQATTQGMSGCSKLAFAPSVSSRPTSAAASSPTGLDFALNLNDEGFDNPKGIAGADIEKAVVTLPEGMSVNPSQAEGLEVCTIAQVQRERADSPAGSGCPNASKIGTLEVETPALPESILHGSLFVAKPYDNLAANSLIALYLVIKDAKLGINVVQPARVESDPVTGRLTTITEGMPEVPISRFALHFREGTRSPLATPPDCGRYDGHDASHEPVRAQFYPTSGQAPADVSSSFEIITGPDGGPCPKGGLPPFHPELLAGTLNNAAAAFSPFNVKITRTDSEQEFTNFSIKLPPGVAGKLAGIPFCSEAQIANAIARTGPHGGQEELDNPSCPAASQVGRTLAGSGVGPTLAYAPGKIYLAGPYHGAPISFVSITAGVVGPFDIGTVVVRLAIKVNPETGEVFLDSTGSDPIPHIIKGIPIRLRDIRAYTDRPEFTFNPTSCARKATAATVLGSGLDFVSEADNNPFVSTSPFQAADCAALPFKPRLSLKLIGGTRRGAHPALKAFLRMNGFGEAGVARARVTLPRSEFIENAHFDTICTRAQFKLQGGNGEACPAGSIYGWARAKSPILAEPVEGPIFLRSSEHQLPDVVASLRGQEIDVHLVGHVDSVDGRLRNTFETVPDAPVEWASFKFKGAKKGLFVNSTNLCKKVYKAKVELSGQNGKVANYGAPLKVKCKKAKPKKAKSQKKARR